MTSIGILGSGMVAETLAGGFLKKGYDKVMVGSGHPEKIAEWPGALGSGLGVGSFQETAAFGDVVVLAVKGTAALDVLESIGESTLEGKVIIDACNPIANTPPEDGVLSFFTEPNSSLMETLQGRFSNARFVKAFSCIGAPLMVDPALAGGKPTLFGCGDDADAKQTVRKIVESFGHEWCDMGTAKAARAIEPLCILWCIPGFRENSWSHAFKLLR